MKPLIGPVLALGWVLSIHLANWDPGFAVDRVLGLAGTLLGVAFLLATFFRRGRLAAAAILALGATALPWLEPQLSEAGPLALRTAALCWASLGLLVMAMGSEWRVASWGGFWRGLFFGGLATGVWWYATLVEQRNPWAWQLREWMERPWGEGPPNDWSPLVLPWTVLAPLGLATLIFLWRVRKRGSAFDVALLTSAVLLGLSGGWVVGGEKLSAAWGFLTLSVVLVVGILAGAYSLAFEDGLTRLPARRALEERLADLGRTYALAMVDIDHFKKLNDRHGHEVGDQVLRMVAAMLAQAPGRAEAFRYGGEEFTLVYPGRSAAEAEPFLDSLRSAIAERRFEVRSPDRPKKKPKDHPLLPQRATRKSLKVTVSIGVADRGGQRASPEAVLKKADKALYKSKRGGRNRVTRG